jgi:hypothetical protein
MTGVPMAQGHLYLPRPAAWVPGRRSGAGPRLSNCYLLGPREATKLIAASFLVFSPVAVLAQPDLVEGEQERTAKAGRDERDGRDLAGKPAQRR